LVVFVIAFLSLVVGELVPKSLAVRHADAIALWVALPIDWLARAVRVAVAALTTVTGLVLRLLGQRGETRSPFHTLEDIRAILDEADEQGVVDAQVVKGALEFQDCEVRYLMTGRARIVGVQRGSSLEAALRIARESGYSRLPVFGLDPDGIEGVVYARDLYEARERSRQDDISAIVRPALLVAPTKKAKDLLAEMRRSQRHMALVVGEQGVVVGLVTLEDVIEAIVGEIRDEHDETEANVRHMREGLLEADGEVTLRELNRRHGLALPESPAYVTVAGLVLERVGKVPQVGETVDVEGYRLTVARMAGRRIERLTIEIVDMPQPA
jgi:putative hemolysin